MPITAAPHIALLGGSFNPPHTGHFRMALEVWEAFSPVSLLFIPCALPPHKAAHNLLPFDLRMRMLNAVLRRYPGMKTSPMERDRPGPSYTVDTLTRLGLDMPGQRLLFILGAEDFAQIPSWSRWRQIPELADLVVLPRNNDAAACFEETVHKLWPEATPCARDEIQNRPGVVQAFSLPRGEKLFYLAQPRLEISSSLVRKRWLAGRSMDFLIPDEIITLLSEHRDTAAALWQSPETRRP